MELGLQKAKAVSGSWAQSLQLPGCTRRKQAGVGWDGATQIPTGDHPWLLTLALSRQQPISGGPSTAEVCDRSHPLPPPYMHALSQRQGHVTLLWLVLPLENYTSSVSSDRNEKSPHPSPLIGCISGAPQSWALCSLKLKAISPRFHLHPFFPSGRSISDKDFSPVESFSFVLPCSPYHGS